MKNAAYIAIPVALLVAAGTWYVLSDRTNESGLTLGSDNAAAVAATVNGTDITNEDIRAIENQVAAAQGAVLENLDLETRAQLRTQALEEVISQTLIKQAAEAANVTVTDEAINAELAAVRASFADDAAYQAALGEASLDEAALRNQIAENLRMQAYFEQTLKLSAITATDEEIETFYNGQVAAASSTEANALPPLEEVRDEVTQFIVQQKQQEVILAHIAELRSAASVTIHDAA